MPACPACGGELVRHRREWVLRCRSCGLLGSALPVEIPQTPTAAGIDEAMREEGLAPLRERNNARIIAAIARLRPPPARLLDVGCGPGFLLSQAQAQGYDAEGIEPDANVVEAARGHGAPVRHGLFPQALAADERYEAIVFNDVLEHIPDVAGAVAASAARLTSGGVLCLNCPDRRGLFFRTAAAVERLGLAAPYERLWQRGLPSPHVWYFTPGDLTRLAKRAGLRPAGALRLDSIALTGLWRRIRYVRSEPLPIAVAAYAFSAASFPLTRLFPDSVAAFFVRPAGP